MSRNKIPSAPTTALAYPGTSITIDLEKQYGTTWRIKKATAKKQRPFLPAKLMSDYLNETLASAQLSTKRWLVKFNSQLYN